jgi:multimeric flavodoxin WrbA
MPRPTKAQQIFLYGASFPALAFFKIWSGRVEGSGSLLILVCCMLAYCALVIGLAYRWDKPTYFDWAIAAFFAAATSLLAVFPERAGSILVNYAVTGIYASLFSAAFFPPLFGLDPFTYHYAKKSTPKAVWGNPIFVTINRIMTYVWAGLFAACIALSLYPSVVTRALIPMGLLLGFGLPFNIRFPDYYLKRLGLPSLAEQRRMAQLSGGKPSPNPESSRISEDEKPASQPESSVMDPIAQDKETGKEKTMKVLALNSSPRGEGQSKTGVMLDHLTRGMRDAGAELEIVELRKKTVKNCIGCYTCWTKTPGVCVHQDDMTKELFPKWRETDLVVYATPLYHYTITASMKAFIERTLPAIQPFFEIRDGRTVHPTRWKFTKTVTLSVAGFPEDKVFDQLSSYVTFLFGKGLLAEIYRPAAETMMARPFRKQRDDILEATAQAGRELVESESVSEETMARIKQPLGDPQVFARTGNLFWKTCIAEGVTPREFREKGLVPRPDSIETYMAVFQMGFNAKTANDTKGTLQFLFSGEVEGSCHFTIEDGSIEAASGTAEKPDLTVEAPFDVWMDVITGKADGQEMFMAQKYKAVGDLSLLMRMGELFGG